jgi:ADP-ribosyltransferase exoenzyme
MMPLPQHTLLKRGTGWPPDLKAFQANPDALLGKTFEDPGFVSTTVAGSSGHFSGQALQLVIEAPKGTPAAFVNGVSDFKDEENEMLLAAGTRFKVLSVEKTTAGHTLLRVRVVGDK